MNKDEAFRAAAMREDRATMVQVASEAVKSARSASERKRWERRLAGVKEGKLFKFSRRPMEDLR